MTIAQAWSIRLSALTIIVLIPGIVYLGAWREPTREAQNAVAGSKTSDLSEQEEEDIEWNQLCGKLLAQSIVQWKDQPEPKFAITPVPDSPRRLVLSAERKGKTAERHGLLRLEWDQRTTRRIELLEVSDERHVVIKTEAFVELKAPLGGWRLEKLDFHHAHLVGQWITGKRPNTCQPMFK